MVRNRIPFVLVIIGIVLIAAAGLWFVFSRQLGSAAVNIDSSPESNVYINGELVGRTPYVGEHNAGEISIKLLPLSFDSPRIPFEGKLKLTAGVETILRRNLGETQLDSSGEIISFEKTGQSDAAVTVVTTPDNAEVSLEGKNIEHSPVRFSDLETREYKLKIRAEGYQDQEFSISPQLGYTLTALVDLAKSPQEELINQPANEVGSEKKILILSTPTGFLRVRSGPSQDDGEVGRVEPGEEFPLLETSQDEKWYKIDMGWISSEYAEIK